MGHVQDVDTSHSDGRRTATPDTTPLRGVVLAGVLDGGHFLGKCFSRVLVLTVDWPCAGLHAGRNDLPRVLVGWLGPREAWAARSSGLRRGATIVCLFVCLKSTEEKL